MSADIANVERSTTPNSTEKFENGQYEYARSGAGSDVEGSSINTGLGRVIVTDADNKRIVRKIDIRILSVLMWVYLLQMLDKSVISYAAVFGLAKDTHLHGNEYSFVGSMGYIAQLAWLPFSTWLVVRVPPRILAAVLVFCWGASLTGMAGAKNDAGLLATRFFLGLFEAACLPLFSFMVSNWYRRAEQPLRIAAFYSGNGTATIIGSAIVYGLGHVKASLYPYQIIFLVFGLITVVSAPFIYYSLDNSVASARFLEPEDRIKGVERLRANQSAVHAGDREDGTFVFKWAHVWECLLEPKTWLFFAMSWLLNLGASVSSVFGALILNGLGFTPYTTTLLNLPFGALQFIVIMASSFFAWHFKNKGFIFACLMVPVVIGTGMLWGLGRSHSEQPALLVAYYLIAFIFAGNPIMISWIAANTAGQTKKSTMLALNSVALSVGNIIGPQLFKAKDKPEYKPGLKAVMACFITLIGLIMIQMANLRWLNHRKEAQRVRNGKPAKLADLSMTKTFVEEDVNGSAPREKVGGATEETAERLDMTDQENDEFQYVL